MSAHIPDLHHFCNRGGKDAIPLWRDPDATEPNVTVGLLETLGTELGCEVAPEDLFAYAYALLASPAYVDRFSEELTVPGPRLPLTRDPALFQRAAALGAELIRLHTYGERSPVSGLESVRPEPVEGSFMVRQAHHERVSRASETGRHRPARQTPPGIAKCVHAVGETPDAYPDRFEYTPTTQTLWVGAGQFAPVSPQVWEFSVSGFKVVQSWLRYRMRGGAGKRSSPLDDIRPTRWTADFTRELLELLWTLEATLDHHPALADLLDAITAGPTFTAAELPQPSDQQRQAPKIDREASRGSGIRRRG